jgi:hypothetical protein
MTSEHEKKADELERELDDMQERSGKLEDEIEGAGEDWEQKKRDPGVPGAPEDGASDEDEDGDGGDDVSAEELDFGREVDKQDIVGAPADARDDED